jgi:hypothetical protein
MTTTEGWHLSDDEVRTYAAGSAAAAQRWSVEVHMAGCALCRDRLAAAVAPHVVDSGWARIDAELDAPVPGWVERVLTRFGVPGHVARLLAATPTLRTSWLAALATTAALMAVLANTAHPVVFLVAAPLLPLLGVAASFGPRVDPTFEVTLVAPVDKFRLLLLRCAAVLSVTTALSAAASLALPRYGLPAVGWFLPALTLTLLTLAASPRLGPSRAAVAAGLGWIVLALSPLRSGVVLTAPGQGAIAVTAVCVAVVVVLMRPAFDTSRFIDRAPRAGAGRMS